jgi:hypothetical protein
VDLRRASDALGHLRAEDPGVDADLLEQGHDHALAGLQEGGEQVVGRDLRRVGAAGGVEGGVERLLRLDGPAVRVEGHACGFLLRSRC